MGHEEPVEALFARSALRGAKDPAARSPLLQPSSLRAAAAELHAAKQRVEEELDCVLDMHRRSSSECHIDRIKNDNVMLFKTNQDLRLLIRDLQDRLRRVGPTPEAGTELAALRAKTAQLEQELAQVRTDLAKAVCASTESVPLERHRCAVSELRQRLSAAEEQLKGQAVAPAREPGPAKAAAAKTLDSSRSGDFFFARSDLMWEIERLRGALKAAQQETHKKDSAIAELQATLARQGQRASERGPPSRLDTTGLSEVEALRAENARLRDSIRATVGMNTKNREEIDRLSALVARLGSTQP